MQDSTAKEGYFNRILGNDAQQQATVSKAAQQALERLSAAEKDDVTSIAASQIELLSRFYDLSLIQAQRSFRWALVASMAGLLFFLAAIGFMLWNIERVSTITLVSGGLIEFIAGINFYLYGKTLAQLTLFQSRLEVTQRFLLANSLTETLGQDYRDKTRALLIGQMAEIPSSYYVHAFKEQERSVWSRLDRGAAESASVNPSPVSTGSEGG
ncbi:MAG: hypothetical protein WAQ53_14955 [Thiofilum sp.]|uniref:TRADD-N-associated membrane domain-containing protein n=1 Tax=Thiofilum sp. TaxID=2212733 RepID=UPI0025E4C922|nr:hypothetical protein [Thiofilum sp.]MBK8451854.1 hypothetical protein [Thiofilum sp.]